MSNDNVVIVDEQYMQAALLKLEAVDVEAANAFRSQMDAYLLFDATLDIRDMLLEFAKRARDLATQAEEMAVRLVKGDEEG